MFVSHLSGSTADVREPMKKPPAVSKGLFRLYAESFSVAAANLPYDDVSVVVTSHDHRAASSASDTNADGLAAIVVMMALADPNTNVLAMAAADVTALVFATHRRVAALADVSIATPALMGHSSALVRLAPILLSALLRGGVRFILAVLRKCGGAEEQPCCCYADQESVHGRPFGVATPAVNGAIAKSVPRNLLNGCSNTPGRYRYCPVLLFARGECSSRGATNKMTVCDEYQQAEIIG